MERKIGEIFDFGGVRLEVLEQKTSGCAGCIFNDLKFDCCFNMILKDIGSCNPCFRTDGKSVIFKKLTTHTSKEVRFLGQACGYPLL